MKLTFESIQLTADDLKDEAARHASAQEIYSPTAPKQPIAQFGWRDRWWLNNSAAQQVAINYWFFESHDEACTAADEGRLRLSALTMPAFGGRASIYQPPLTDDHALGDVVWQAGANFLFVHESVVVLVAEIGKKVSAETTLRIAQKVREKIDSALLSK